MQRRTAMRIAAPILVIAVLVAVVVVGLRLATPAQTPGPPPGSTTLTTGRCDGLGICTPRGSKPAPCPTTATTSKLVDGAGKPLQSWDTSCGPGKDVVAAYSRFIAAYNTLLDNPYGDGLTPWQELGHIYDEEAAGTLTATQIPKGCTIPPPSAHPISWPAPCDQLLSKGGNGDPLAPVATALNGIATSAGRAHMRHVLSVDLNAGYATSGQLVAVSSPIVRQIVSKGGGIFTTAPNPGAPLAAWPASTAKAAVPTAVVWACLVNHLITTNHIGEHGPSTAYWAMNVYLVQTTAGWRVSGWGEWNVPAAISKGAPCGTAY